MDANSDVPAWEIDDLGDLRRAVSTRGLAIRTSALELLISLRLDGLADLQPPNSPARRGRQALVKKGKHKPRVTGKQKGMRSCGSGLSSGASAYALIGILVIAVPAKVAEKTQSEATLEITNGANS
jgi:hypothetical protein